MSHFGKIVISVQYIQKSPPLQRAFLYEEEKLWHNKVPAIVLLF